MSQTNSENRWNLAADASLEWCERRTVLSRQASAARLVVSLEADVLYQTSAIDEERRYSCPSRTSVTGVSTLTKSEISVKKFRKRMGRMVEDLVSLSDQLRKPLSTLNDQQASAVVALFLLERAIEQTVYTLEDRGAKTIDLFKNKLGEAKPILAAICPDVQSVDLAMDPCLEAMIAYGAAMASCADEDPPREDDCWEAQKYMPQLLACAMERLEGSRRNIGDILRGRKPPLPGPDPRPF